MVKYSLVIEIAPVVCNIFLELIIQLVSSTIELYVLVSFVAQYIETAFK
jgi:hypothetical protein